MLHNKMFVTRNNVSKLKATFSHVNKRFPIRLENLIDWKSGASFNFGGKISEKDINRQKTSTFSAHRSNHLLEIDQIFAWHEPASCQIFLLNASIEKISSKKFMCCIKHLYLIYALQPKCRFNSTYFQEIEKAQNFVFKYRNANMVNVSCED